MDLSLLTTGAILGIPLARVRSFLARYGLVDVSDRETQFLLDPGRMNLHDRNEFHLLDVLVIAGLAEPRDISDRNDPIFRLTEAGAALMVAPALEAA